MPSTTVFAPRPDNVAHELRDPETLQSRSPEKIVEALRQFLGTAESWAIYDTASFLTRELGSKASPPLTLAVKDREAAFEADRRFVSETLGNSALMSSISVTSLGRQLARLVTGSTNEKAGEIADALDLHLNHF